MTQNSAPADGVVHVWIYKGSKQMDSYLYVGKADGFDALPADLRLAMGRLEFVMEIDLFAGRSLARADAVAVLEAIHSRGYYLQLPPVDSLAVARVH